MKSSRINILHVEDDEVDARIFANALRAHGCTHAIHLAGDGEAALTLLRDGRIRLPFIVVLDIGLPGMSGIEFLRALRADPDLRRAVVFVLTTSSAPHDIEAAYAHQAAGYFIKQMDPRAYAATIAVLARYWEETELPGGTTS